MYTITGNSRHVCTGFTMELIEIFGGDRVFCPCIGFRQVLIGVEFAPIKRTGIVIDSARCSRTHWSGCPVSEIPSSSYPYLPSTSIPIWGPEDDIAFRKQRFLKTPKSHGKPKSRNLPAPTQSHRTEVARNPLPLN